MCLCKQMLVYIDSYKYVCMCAYISACTDAYAYLYMYNYRSNTMWVLGGFFCILYIYVFIFVTRTYGLSEEE